MNEDLNLKIERMKKTQQKYKDELEQLKIELEEKEKELNRLYIRNERKCIDIPNKIKDARIECLMRILKISFIPLFLSLGPILYSINFSFEEVLPYIINIDIAIVCAASVGSFVEYLKDVKHYKRFLKGFDAEENRRNINKLKYEITKLKDRCVGTNKIISAFDGEISDTIKRQRQEKINEETARRMFEYMKQNSGEKDYSKLLQDTYQEVYRMEMEAENHKQK